MHFKNLLASIGVFMFLICGATWAMAAGGPFRILHIMSYHAPWEWTDDQFRGFKDGLKGVDVEYRVFQMDTKRRSTEAWKEKVGREARDLIDSWKPDLVYTNDDNAQEYVTRFYINRETPFVFSGVNADPGAYGFVGSDNVTGILEQEHFVETVRFLKELVPAVKKIAVIVDDDPTWPGVMRRMKQHLPGDLPDIEIPHWDVISTFEAYKNELNRLRRALHAWNAKILYISEEISVKAMFFVEQHFLSHAVQLADALIGATAISHGLPILTGNDKHYSILKGVQIKKFRP